MDSTLYKKIETHLMDTIMKNADISDYKLPSERALSIMFNTSRKPVRHAYTRLISRGFVTNIHGKGYFINSNFQNHLNTNTPANNPRISMITPSVLSHYAHNILTGVSDFCTHHQLELSIYISDSSAEKEEQLLRSVSKTATKGIILFPVEQSIAASETLHQLSFRKYPLVLVDRTVSNIHASFVASENHRALVDAVEFLYKKQYSKIVFMTLPSENASSIGARINGFNHGMLRYYKLISPSNLLVLSPTPAHNKSNIIKYLQTYPCPEVIIVQGLHAPSVLSAAEELGLRIPEDIRLMILDDEMSPAVRARLKPYIIQQDGYQIGYLAAETLRNHIFGDQRPVNRLLPVSVIDTATETLK